MSNNYKLQYEETLYDPLDGQELTKDIVGYAQGQTDDGIIKPKGYFALLEIPIEQDLNNYDYIEVYAVTDDMNIIFNKIYKPVGKTFNLGGNCIGANYIFFKTTAYEVEKNKIKVLKVQDPWGQIQANGGYFYGQWFPGMSDPKVNCNNNMIAITKIVGIKNLTIKEENNKAED